MTKQNVLIINGKKYEATTGMPLDKSNSAKAPTTKKASAKAKNPAPAKAAPKKPASKKPRKPAKNLTAHKPAKASTLMRKSVAKPSTSIKRKVKTTGSLSTSGEMPKIEIKKPAHKVDKKLLSYATKIKKSPLIRHFNPITSTSYEFETAPKPPAPKPTVKTKTANRKPQTTEELLEYAISQATSHEQPLAPKPKRKIKLKLKRKA